MNSAPVRQLNCLFNNRIAGMAERIVRLNSPSAADPDR